MFPDFQTRSKFFHEMIAGVERRIASRREQIDVIEKDIIELEKEKDELDDMLLETNEMHITELKAKGQCVFCEFTLPQHSLGCAEYGK